MAEEQAPETTKRRGGKSLKIIVPVVGLVLVVALSAVFFAALINLSGTFNAPTGNALASAGQVVVGADCAVYQNVKLTAYLTGPGVKYTSSSQKNLEGGPNDRTGKVNKTLFEYIQGKYTDDPYVSVAADVTASSPFAGAYHVKAYIPEVEKSLNSGKEIVFRIVDTGGAFSGRKADKMDIAVSQASQMNTSVLNKPTTVYVGNGCTRASVNNIATNGGGDGICSFCQQQQIPLNSTMNQNFGVPKVIIMHYLSGDDGNPPLTVQGAIDYFRSTTADNNPDNNKYVQFIIGHDGVITQLIPETKQAAGAEGYNTANGGITISIENEGHFEDNVSAHNYTQKQLDANVQLVKYLMQKYSIPKADVISHKQADQRRNPPVNGRRSDPGEKFMQALLSQV